MAAGVHEFDLPGYGRTGPGVFSEFIQSAPTALVAVLSTWLLCLISWFVVLHALMCNFRWFAARGQGKLLCDAHFKWMGLDP